MKGQTGNRKSWLWWLTVLIVMVASPVYALGIGVNRSPVPPDCVLNDGTDVEQFDWEIQFGSTPDHYIEVLLDPDGDILYCVFHDLIGWTTTLPAAWSMCAYSDESATWPQASPVVDFNSWLAPAAAQLGRYEIRIQFFSVEGGDKWEAEGAVTFYVCQATGSLKLSKWHDLNANGVRDHGEPGIPMWKLSFTDPFGSTFNRLTDANGNVVEDTLPIGHYNVWETVKPGWTNSTPVAFTVGVLTGKETKVSFGNYETGSIGDYVWLDANRDGVQDNDETGIPNVTLALWLDSNGDGTYDSQVSTEITDENGWYLFDELPPGKYRVEVDESTLPPGAHVLTTNNEPFPYELAPEEDMLEADFGYFKCNVEKCNGIDDDCDDETDEDFPVDEACDGDDGDQCKNGTWSCGDDGWSVECVNESVTDIADICNGEDDDCDGSTDEDFTVGDPCDGDDGDKCETGTFTCAADGSAVECVNESNPDITGLCDGQDNDCDGETDEYFPLLGQACDSADSDLCSNGHFECHPPSICRDPAGCNQPLYECVNDFPSNIVEVCDGADNDCDGAIDEGLGTSTCGVGACEVTTDNCIGGRPESCQPGTPVDEVCDLVDNDCDGSVDEGLGTTSCGTGVCAMTVEFCVDGQIQSCDPGNPGDEICDGMDNDCDGVADEDLGTTTCGTGACVATVENCVNGHPQTCVPGAPGAEICDGIHNDCDGAVDEELGATTCGIGACVATVDNCVAGEVQTCVPGAAGEETCDLVDNDCDGAVDEDLGTTTCGVGACVATVDNCVAGEVQTCVPGAAGDETCDLVDNDCDGAVDEDLGTTICGVGACVATVDNCVAGEVQTCVPGTAGDETCDLVDNDCDGAVDEDLGTTTCGTGACTATVDNCVAGAVQSCVPGVASGEVCDLVDNDCDGAVDEDLGTTSCGVGACEATVDNCVAGVVQSCVPGEALDEVCDLIDNDCDGAVDEELGTTTCGVGACVATVDNCVDGVVQSCVPGASGTEICDLIDNDCDGTVDEDLGTTTCGVGACTATVDNCIDGEVQGCVPGAPVEEACDLVDNDCDGAVDEDLGTTTCGQGVCQATAENCVDGQVLSCVPGDSFAEVCDNLDNDCDGVVDNDLGTTTCGVGACKATVNNCVAGAPQVCQPGAPGEEVCGNLVDEDCDGMLNEGCDSGDDCELPDGCVGLSEAFARGWIMTDVSGSSNSSVDIYNFGSAPVCLDEFLLLLSDPTQSLSTDVDTADGQAIEIAPGGKVTLQYGPWTFPNGSYQAQLNQPPWWCVEDGQYTTDGAAFAFYGEATPAAIVALIADETDLDNDGKEDHVDWAGSLGTQTVYNIWAYQSSHSMLTAGKVALAGDPGTVNVVLTSHNIGALPGLGTLADTLPEGYSAGNFSVEPDGMAVNPDGSTTLFWGIELAGYEDMPGTDGSTVFDVTEISYDLYPALDANGARLELPKATMTFVDGEAEQVNVSASVFAINVDVDGDGFPACEDCIDSDALSFPGGVERCDGLDNDCDDAVDEDFSDLGDGCDDGIGECNRAGEMVCAADGLGTECNAVPGEPVDEVCDLLDNDCDELVDEELGSTTCGVGACVASVENCINGEVQTCVPGDPTDELCDLIDNDCDGELDEDLGTTTCGVGECEVTIDNCGDGSADLVAFAAGLPAQVQKIVSHPGTGFGAPSYYDVQILGQSILAGTYDAYCVDTDTYITPGATYTANVYSSYDAIPEGLMEFPENLDLVNYIINQGYVGTLSQGGSVFTYGDVQRAIWTLIDDGLVTNGLGTWSQARVDEILADALAEGEGFEPDCDQYIGVILDPIGDNQLTIAQVTMALVAGSCNPNQECVPGEPSEEICDGLDNDCDGEVDEDLGTTTCGIGACEATTDNCVGGVVQSCAPGAPADEICDLIDNDCDGSVDEDLGISSCGVGTCQASVENCIDGQVQSCVAGDPSEELCDGLDNDCDGDVDEGLGSTTCGVGSCEATVENCVDGQVQTCVPGDPIEELCDFADNDCDGQIDNDLGTTTCGVGECEVTIENCGEGSADLLAFAAGLPTQVQKIISHPGTGFGAPSYYDVKILGESILAGTYDSYCVDTDTYITPGTTYTANVYSSYDAIPDGLMEFPENLDLVNYILNQDYVGTPSQDGSLFTYGDVQRAIWTLIDDGLVTNGLGAWSQARVDEILADALAEGEGFEPDCDQYIGVILDPVGNNQLTIAQVTMALIPGSCDPNQECVPGEPSEEICDGLDNDCDGEIDEGLGSTTCGVGECVNTIENCVAGQVQSCDPFLGAGDETCDLLDNDCDGEIDEELGTTTCGVGECEVTIDNCGDGGSDLVAFAAGLPAQVQKIISHPGTGFGAPSYYDVKILGESILAGTYDAYCVDTDTYITPGATYTVNVYSSYDVIPDGLMEFPENLDLVNYILNQGYVGTPSQGGSVFTYGDVQRAIWTLIDDGLLTNGLGAWSQARVDEILADALAEGEGFEPDCDQYIGVILDPVGNNQLTIAQVTMALVPGSCNPNQECVPGTPTDEICDGLDNDCDGEIDEDLGTASCGIGACTATVDYCVDGVVQTCIPGNPVDEACDLADNDCDGQVDEGLGTTTCGVGECENTVDYCVDGQVQSCVPGDAATEICDAQDNDCDGSIDEGFNLGESCSTGGCGGENLEVWAVSDEDEPLIVATADAVLTGSTLACNFEHSYDGMAEYKEFFIDTVLTINDDFAPSLLYAYGAYDGADWTGMDDTLDDMVADGDVGSYDMWDVSAGTPLDLQPGDLDGVDVVILDAAPDTAANHFVVTDGSKQVLRDFQDGGGKLIVSAYIFVYWKNYTSYGYELQNEDMADLVGNVLPDITKAAWPTATTLEASPHGAGETLVTLIGAEPWHKKPADPFFHEFWVLDASPVVSACYSEGEYVCAADGTAECNAEVILPGEELCGDKIDNDCDCEADEGFDNVGNACSAGVGACLVAGEIVCSADGLGEVCGAVAGEPTDEICDGIDNDCDGSVDEGLGTTTCGVGTCLVTIESCVAGVPQVCQPGAPTDEVCDGADNDCDGSTDEDLGTTTCGVGACQATVEYCVGGQVSVCTPGDPSGEVCDLVDNDCDGSTDEGLGVTTCGQGVCQVTVVNCVAGELQSCEAATPSSELCDGLDNDCDGLEDEGLGTSTCGAGACKVTVQNCVNGAWQVCTAGTPGTEVCDGIDNDCDGVVDEGLGTLSCGAGACENSVQACVNGQTQQCTPGTPGAELCGDLTDNDCDGSIDEGCDANDDCELPAGCVSLAEAFARDWIAIDTPSYDSSAVTIHNLGPVEVCLDEHLLFISDPTQSMTNGTKKANGQAMKIAAGGKINLQYGPWTFPNGYYQPYLNHPSWWCVEYGQLSTKNTLFGYYGEQAPEMVQYYLDNKTDTDGDGKEDHVDWGGSYGTKTLYNIWGYQNSHGVLTAGKVAGAAGPGTIAVALTSHNLGAFSAQGVLVDTIPAGYWVENFSLDPDGWVDNNDGTVTVFWNIDLEGYEDKAGWNDTTVFDVIEISYDLHADWDEDGKRIELPRAQINFNDGQHERTSKSALVIAINVDVDGDGFGGCQDCDNGDQDVYPGADEVCDGADNDCDGNVDEGCPVCGNGIIEDGEICDDGDENDDVMYACQTDCTLSIMWPTSGQTTIAYEDLPQYGGNDWDYNDWIIELEVEYIFNADGVKQIRFYADPWARGAAYHHSQGIAIAMGTYTSTGTYQVKHYNTAWEKTGEDAEVTFGAAEDIAITMFADTWETLPPNSVNGDTGVWSFDANTEIGYGTVLGPKVGVEFHFDTALPMEPAQLLNTAPGTHCENMPYDLYLLVNNTGEYIANGDTRMLCVPDYWDWPSEKQSIWNVYDGITPANGGPIFDDGWYLAAPIGSTWYAGQ